MSPEILLERIVASVDPDELSRARAAFFERTGSFEPADAFYEERVRAFFDWMAIEWEGASVIGRFLARPEVSDEERAMARSLAGSMRSLFKVLDRDRDGDAVLESMIGGARFQVARGERASSRLTAGDVLDGRVLAIEGRVWLAPGPVFHPRETHDAIDRLLEEAAKHDRRDERLLDPLLRMRMRFDRFTDMNARHVYRYDALDRTEILSAAWRSESEKPPDSKARRPRGAGVGSEGS